MSVTVLLRKCTSEEIRLTKSFEAGTDISLSGNFRENEDILNPVITIESTTNLSEYNYAEIEDFGGRKYFMRPEVINNKIWRLHCRVDVLSTYAAGIRASGALVQRTAKEDKINFYINDASLYTEQREVIKYMTFKKDNQAASFGSESYYLITAGG